MKRRPIHMRLLVGVFGGTRIPRTHDLRDRSVFVAVAPPQSYIIQRIYFLCTRIAGRQIKMAFRLSIIHIILCYVRATREDKVTPRARRTVQ
jgi:hypothetical protein